MLPFIRSNRSTGDLYRRNLASTLPLSLFYFFSSHGNSLHVSPLSSFSSLLFLLCLFSSLFHLVGTHPHLLLHLQQTLFLPSLLLSLTLFSLPLIVTCSCTTSPRGSGIICTSTSFYRLQSHPPEGLWSTQSACLLPVKTNFNGTPAGTWPRVVHGAPTAYRSRERERERGHG